MHMKEEVIIRKDACMECGFSTNMSASVVFIMVSNLKLVQFSIHQIDPVG